MTLVNKLKPGLIKYLKQVPLFFYWRRWEQALAPDFWKGTFQLYHTVTISRAIWKWPAWYVILFICSDIFKNLSKICSVLLSEHKLCLTSFIFLIHTSSLTCPVSYKLTLSKLSHCEFGKFHFLNSRHVEGIFISP